MKILILAGGTGTRLWPVSRIYNPKQFTKFRNMGKSAFQNTVEMAAKIVSQANIFIVTNKEYKYFVFGQLSEINMVLPEGNIILEPSFKNTLHAVSAGVFKIYNTSDENANILVVPSNSSISDYFYLFKSHIQEMALPNDCIVSFGIAVTGAHTECGYIKPTTSNGNWSSVERFVEKPSQEDAQKYSIEGYLCSSGMLFFQVKVFIEELKLLAKDVYKAFEKDDLEAAYNSETHSTIEHGILERTKKLVVVKLGGEWSNIDEFANFYKQYNEKQDDKGNISFSDDIFIDSSNNFIYTDSNKAIGVIGVDNLVVINQPDALLVCNSKSTDRVREVAEILKARGDSRAEYHTTCYRPWGSFTVLEEGKAYKIKRITVLPGKKLSYQMHYHRSEHWVTVKGTSTVIKDGKELIVKEGESIFISVGEKHRLENRGKTLLEIIEVQIGAYLGEDDIVRFEDEYGR